MTTVLQGLSETITLPAGQQLTVIADALSSGRLFPFTSYVGDTPGLTAVAASATVLVGPFATDKRYQVETLTGFLTYTAAPVDFPTASEALAAALGTVAQVIQYADVTVTSAQLLALNATPRTILTAPAAGFANVLVDVVAYKAAGVAYAGVASGEDLAVKETDASGAVLATIETTGFLDQVTAQTRYAAAYKAASGVNSATPSALALVLHLLSGEIITGDSDLKLRVYYRTVPTTL